MDSNSIDKKALKAQKKAEKLAKLQAKTKITQTAPKIKKPQGNGYDPSEVEKYWTKYWLDNQSFLPKNNDNKFVICIPPPNITGSLHIGHAMMISIEDCIVRFKRLNKNEVLYLPGLDHAGIATQNVVMKNLSSINKDECITRDDFLKAAFEWSDKYGNRIYEQFNRMGTSLDYSRKAFTLDKNVNRSVNVAFCRLYEKGLIYRDNKIVNWCGKLKTTLSDLEVNYKEVKGGSYIEVDEGRYRFGMLYYFKYYIVKDDDIKSNPYVVIATTRPETILGDSAICINPLDERFKDIEKVFKEGTIPMYALDQNQLNDNPSDNNQLNDNPSDNNQLNDNPLDDNPLDNNPLDTFKEDTIPTSPSNNNINQSLNINLENEEIKKERKNKFKINKSTQSETIQTTNSTLFAINPLTNEKIPVIFDSHADLSFGTGILKITPSHDPIDFKLGKKHNLKFNSIMDENNKITHPKYKGINRFEARKLILEELRNKDLLVKEEEHDQVLPFCSRSNDIIEPMIKEQWWLNCKEMARKAIDGVKNNEIQIFPEEARGIWFRWLENIRDWCLSRQLWWGHRIPAYKIKSTGEWIVAETYEEALKKGDIIEQDEDVLDTWFSSGLWPFSTLGWPDNTMDFEKYFPNSLLETGSDILFFWVARMVMLSYELTGKKPFDRIFLHGIVRDAHGRKMSKSLGNVIDPLYVIDGIGLEEMIENLNKGNLDSREVKRATDALKKDFPNGIPKCGADALRFTLLSYTNGMKDINLDIMRVQGYSRLCNKIYNAYKFINSIINDCDNMDGCDHDGDSKNSNNSDITLVIEKIKNLLKQKLKPHQIWILKRLNQTIKDQHRQIESYNFMMGTQSIYQLFFDFCDNIIEVSKNDTDNTNKSILKYVFINILKMFHPYMPFITEDLHFKLCNKTIEDYPVEIEIDNDELIFEDILELAKLCRSKKKVQVERSENDEYIKRLTKDSVEIVEILKEYEVIGNFKYRIIE